MNKNTILSSLLCRFLLSISEVRIVTRSLFYTTLLHPQPFGGRKCEAEFLIGLDIFFHLQDEFCYLNFYVPSPTPDILLC